MTTAPIVEVSGASMRFGATIALDDVSFTIGGGTVCGLLGRNGSGKTTLLALLAGFRKPRSGTVTVGGHPVFENSAAVRDICLIRDTADTVDGAQKVRDALDFAAVMRPHWDAAYAESLLDAFSLDPGKPISTLSLGRRSALGVILGLASRAPLTAFDESYLGMDAPSRQVFYNELLSVPDGDPRTIILSTHLIDEVGALFEEVVLLDKGRLLLHEEADVLRSRGCEVTGHAETVDSFSAGATVLSEKRLGNTKSVMLYGAADDTLLDRAAAAGLDVGPVGLQELFVHLTEPSRSPE